MLNSPDLVTRILFHSLIESQPLLVDLPEGTVFPCRSLVLPEQNRTLNFQQKLGHLYEDTLAMLLEVSPRYECVANGVQIFGESGQTLGELDFLVRDLETRRLIHLELAVKFYLAVETDGGVSLPGPDARDNYFRKLGKMRSHQLMLVEKFRDLLPDAFREERDIVVQQLTHGCIFEHVHASKPVDTEYLNPDGRRGKWLYAAECDAYFDNGVKLEVIPKPLWPAPLETFDGVELEPWKPEGELERCVMVRIVGDNVPHFIAPNAYPSLSGR